MMETVIELSNPVWVEPDKAIRFDAVLSGTEAGTIDKLVARSDDPPTAEFFHKAVAGEYGSIGAYVPDPPPPDPEA